MLPVAGHGRPAAGSAGIEPLQNLIVPNRPVEVGQKRIPSILDVVEQKDGDAIGSNLNIIQPAETMPKDPRHPVGLLRCRVPGITGAKEILRRQRVWLPIHFPFMGRHENPLHAVGAGRHRQAVVIQTVPSLREPPLILRRHRPHAAGDERRDNPIRVLGISRRQRHPVRLRQRPGNGQLIGHRLVGGGLDVHTAARRQQQGESAADCKAGELPPPREMKPRHGHG